MYTKGGTLIGGRNTAPDRAESIVAIDPAPEALAAVREIRVAKLRPELSPSMRSDSNAAVGAAASPFCA